MTLLNRKTRLIKTGVTTIGKISLLSSCNLLSPISSAVAKNSFCLIDTTSVFTILNKLIHPETPKTTITENIELPNKANISTMR